MKKKAFMAKPMSAFYVRQTELDVIYYLLTVLSINSDSYQRYFTIFSSFLFLRIR